MGLKGMALKGMAPITGAICLGCFERFSALSYLLVGAGAVEIRGAA
jgi:hypothetical protein